MLPCKRSREQGSKVKIEHLKANKPYGLLVSRLSEDHFFTEGLPEASFFPKINDRNGGFCLIYAEDKKTLRLYKSMIQKKEYMKLTEFNVTTLENQKKSKNFYQVFDDLDSQIRTIYQKYITIKNDIDSKIIRRRSANPLIEELCENVKNLSEEFIIRFQDDLMLAFYDFSEEYNNCDWSFDQFSRKILLGSLSFMQTKVLNKRLESSLYFFEHFNGKTLIERFNTIRSNEKAYIIDILFQLIFVRDAFKDEETMYISINHINFTKNLFKMKNKFKSILVAILNSFSQKYFREIEIYYLQVKKFIDSIKITRLPKGLNGLTIINSTVLINSENLMSHQSNKYFFEVYNSFEVSSESEEEKFEEKPEEIEEKLNEDYKTSKENQEKPQVEYVGSHGFILMTCIHEFAHFIERSQIKKVSEWFSLRTPRDFSSNSLESQTNKKLNSGELKDVNQNLLTVEGNQMNQSLRCVEGGRIFMRKIFGFEVETLNHYQALFILNPENWNMNQDVFQEKFKSESNKENPPEYAEYYPVRCMISSNPFLIEIGECGTASGFKWSKNYNFS